MLEYLLFLSARKQTFTEDKCIKTQEGFKEFCVPHIINSMAVLGFANRAAVCDITCLEAVVRTSGWQNYEALYDNRKKFASFSLTSPALFIERLIPVSFISNYGSTL